MKIHPTHAFPSFLAAAWTCTRCGCRPGTVDAELRCVSDGPLFQDAPEAVAECDKEIRA